jgi:peptide/nickel transport system permease protein
MIVNVNGTTDGRNPITALLRRSLRRPLGLLSAIWLVVLLVACLFPRLFDAQDPLFQNFLSVLSGPTSHHLLGTDELGRDVLSRILYGSRISLLVVLEAVSVWFVLGLLFGILAGYFGGVTDKIVTRLAELAFSLPTIIVLLVVLAVFTNNEQIAMLVFGVIASAGLVRVVRGSTLAIKEETYIAAAQVAGISRVRIILRHILPSLRRILIVQTSVFAGVALITETGLAFLGFGAQPPNPSWGGMVAGASIYIERQPWLMVPPSAFIVLTVLAFGLVGNAVGDAVALNAGSSAAKLAAKRRTRPTTVESASGSTRDVKIHDDTLLSICGLSVAFPINGVLVNVVEDVDLEIRRGESVALVGESGSGKTITALCALGMIPSPGVATSGHCYFDARDLLEMDARSLSKIRGREIGFVGQDPMVSLDPNVTVRSLIAEAVRRHTGVNRRTARIRAIELLELVNLPDAAAVGKRRTFELSGGMAQRVAIALALAGEPKLLIADEPTTALDVSVQAEVLALLQRLQQKTGMAILLVTHDWGVVASICQRAAVMYAGQIVERGEVVEVFDRPLHPYTRGLLEANPVLAEKGKQLTTIPGVIPDPIDWPTGCHFYDRCSFATQECRVDPVIMESRPPDRQARCIHINDVVSELTRRE